MSSKVEKTKNANEIKIEIKIDAEKFDNAIKKVYFQSAKYFNIPGFRKGKAPQAIVEKYYGKEIFYEDAFNEIAEDEYKKAIEDNKLDVVSKPEIDIVKMEKGQDLIFTATVQTKPDSKLDKYKGIEIDKIEYNVKASDIKEELKKMQEKNVRIISVEDSPVKNGNITIIDFEGFADGEAFDGGKAENYELEIGSGAFIPGFEEQIIGMKVGDEKDIVVKFPEDYHAKELAGKDATFKVKLHEIKKKELPELDDEFAKDVSEFDTLEELKKSIKERLEKLNKQKEDAEKRDAVINAIVENLEVEIPSGMIEVEIDNMIADMEQRMSYQGLRLEQYLKMLNKTVEQLRTEYEPVAINSIKSRLALEKVIENEKIDATDEEINNKIEEMAKNYGKKPEELQENKNLKNYIIEGIKNEKAIDFLIKNSKTKKTK